MKALALAFVLALMLPLTAQAQTPMKNSDAPGTGPWRADAIVGIQNQSAVDYSSRAALASTASKGQPIALMAVGAAAIVLGALVDNDASDLLIVGGSVIGLYGLYLYLR